MGVGVGFSLGSGWKAADGTVFRASVATLVFPTKSPLNWACARWPDCSLFGHWRSGVAFVQVSCRSTRRGVREHPAPSGALRPETTTAQTRSATSRQGAPSTIRCIKTKIIVGDWYDAHFRVREQPAPSGALRPGVTARVDELNAERQGAPSTIRCIETRPIVPPRRSLPLCVREHPAPSGALRRPCGCGRRLGSVGVCLEQWVLRGRALGVVGAARVFPDLIAPWWVGWLCTDCGGGLAVGVCGALLSWVSEAGHCGGSGFVTRMWCWWECSLVRGVALVGVGWAARGGSCWRCAWRGCRGVRAVVARVLGGR